MSTMLEANLARPEQAADLHVEEIREPRLLARLGPIWDRLLEWSGTDHPFVTHEWVRTWWDFFGGGRELCVLLVRDGDEPVAIAPLMRSRPRVYGMKLRRLEFIANVHTQRSDFIVARDCPEAYRSLWEWLSKRSDQWDVLCLAQLPEGSPTLMELPRLARAEGFLTGLWEAPASPYVPLQEGPEAYLRSLAAKHRSNLRNREKRLAGLGEVRLETIEGQDDLEAALDDGFRIEAAAWKGRSGTALAIDPATRRFYTEFARRAARRGWLRLHFLSVGGRRIAFDYSLSIDGRTFLLKPGYDPEFAPYSPYNLLLQRVLRDELATGRREFDFLGDAERWKLDWTSRTRAHRWLYVMPPTARMRLLYTAKFHLMPRLKRHRMFLVARDAILAAARLVRRPGRPDPGIRRAGGAA